MVEKLHVSCQLELVIKGEKYNQLAGSVCCSGMPVNGGRLRERMHLVNVTLPLAVVFLLEMGAG